MFEILFPTAAIIFSLILAFDVIYLINHLISKRPKLQEEEELQKNSFATKLKKHWVLLINILVFIFSGSIFYHYFVPDVGIEYTYPSSGELWTSYDKPIEVVFDKPIIVTNLDYNMSPKANGDWKFERAIPFLPFYRKLTFTPKESFWPGEKIMIYLSYISNWSHPDPGHEHLLEFQSVALPQIESISIENGQTNIAIDSEILITLDKVNGQFNKWNISLEPQVEFETEERNGDSLVIKFTHSLSQSTQYKLTISQYPQIYDLETEEVIEEGENNVLEQITFTTVKAPLIQEFSPQGGSILPNSAITIAFEGAMDTTSVEENLEISPEIQGAFTWNEDNTVLTFTPTELSIGTNYQIVIKQGAKNAIGGMTMEDITYSFSTVGAVYPVSIIPSNNSTDVDPATNISVTFDQPVDQQSAQSHFSVSPNVGGSFSWSGNTMTFNPSSDLVNNTQYTISLSNGIKSVYGYDSSQNYSYSFTIKPMLVLLNISWDGQDTAWTCNFAATKMALTAKGVYVSENDLISLAGTEQSFNFTTYSGGNPHKGFVNNYGTYWEPISKAVSSYRENMVKSGWTLSEVCHEIASGNPVVTWGQNGWSTDTPRNWTAPDGEYIEGYSGMHSVVIRGCLGDLDNPSLIYIQDPWRKWGTELSPSEMLRRWSYFGNTGMVIY